MFDNKTQELIVELENALLPLATIADEFDNNRLDEARPEWGDENPATILLVGRNGKTLLTLQNAFNARQALLHTMQAKW